MKSINKKIDNFVRNQGLGIIEFVDISVLPDAIWRGYFRAILIGSVLSKNYLRSITVRGDVDRSEFAQKEAFIDGCAENLAGFLISLGYHSYAQSESNIINDGLIDSKTYTSLLPHKTIALLAGIGWIGKDDLLVTTTYGSGLSICTVLTEAPIIPGRRTILAPQCGTCETCKTTCPEQAIKGNTWEIGCSRESLVDIDRCSRCLKCLVACVWTQRYAQSR
jgi:epoxyqueuosine reductase